MTGEGDASPTGPYQSERGEAKSTTIDATGHTVYNEDGARFTFPSFRFCLPTPLFSGGLEDFHEFARLEQILQLSRYMYTRLSNLDERSNLVKLWRNERVGRRG